MMNLGGFSHLVIAQYFGVGLPPVVYVVSVLSSAKFAKRVSTPTNPSRAQ
jgi:hypothetical protein